MDSAGDLSYFFNHGCAVGPKGVTLEPLKGSTINRCCEEALEVAKELDLNVHFTFNDVPVVAYPTDKNGEEVAERWDKGIQNRK